MGGLSTPPEPSDVKEFVSGLIRAGLSPKYAIWLGNRLQKYLWSFWREYLTASGVSWPDFLRIISRFEDEVVEWALGRLSWSELVEAIVGRGLKTASAPSEGLGRWLRKGEK